MEAVEPGDRVLYIDSDEVAWGPWTVLSVSTEDLIVKVENRIELLLHRCRVQKLNEHNI